ncbi:MAG: DegT/DnrJ/EryC1/StrS family aminotransferase [Fibrobacteraceae bacterium]|nr:DegT/DnrJ/EryC1/StrS family aminotransferase [Fibrobacteraceae bacterium]
MIPFIDLKSQRIAYKEELQKAEQQVLDSGIYIGGPQVEALEEELALSCDKQDFFAVTCGSGTDALTISLSALNLQPGDQVIVPDFTFIAPAECVAQLGATPIFADINPNTLLIDPSEIAKRVTPKTKGIIAVDLFGECAPYQELRKVAQQYGLWILEDSAQAFGATQKNSQEKKQYACTFGDMAITSFYPTKPLGCYGDGGAIFTSNPHLAQKARELANHGSRSRYLHQSVGFNSRLDALQAAVLRIKLRHLEEEFSMRYKKAKIYDDFFMNWKGVKVTPQHIIDGNVSTYAQYTLLAENRERFIQILTKAEIPYCIHYPMPLHKQPCFAHLTHPTQENNSQQISQKVISLPFCAFTDVQSIIEKINSIA